MSSISAHDFEPVLIGTAPARVRWPVRPHDSPVIVFLHGGAEAGADNWVQLVGTLGAVELANRYPDAIVIAPQAPEPCTSGPPKILPFAEMELDPTSGWHRHLLSDLADFLRNLVTDGRADGTRLHLTGISMGGAGVLRMLDVAPGLFASAAPVCPTTTPETYTYLSDLDDTPIWISSAYIDHIPYRHKYLVDGIVSLIRRGHPDARITLFSPEQLAKYGIEADESSSLEEMLWANHSSWEATYRDEDGILTWLMSQSLPTNPLTHAEEAR